MTTTTDRPETGTALDVPHVAGHSGAEIHGVDGTPSRSVSGEAFRVSGAGA